MRTSELVYLVGVLLLAGCTAQPEQPSASPQPAAAEPVAQQPTFKPDVTLNQMMVSIVDHNSHIVWDSAVQAPKTAADWENLEAAAVTLAAGGNLTMAGGSGPEDQKWTQQEDWAKHSQALADAGLVTLQAVQAKDLDGLQKAGDQVLLTCLACHRQYRLTDSKIHAKER
jgi:cytochrome c556